MRALGRGVDGHDLFKFLKISFAVALRFQYPGDLASRLQVKLHRLREIIHIAPADLEHTGGVAIELMQLGRDQEGVAPDLVVRRFPFDTFILIGRQGELIVFPVDKGELSGHFGLQCVIGEIAAESFQHRGGSLPILELDQGRGAVIFGGRPDRRIRCRAAHPQEMVCRNPVFLGGKSLLPLLVDRCREVVGQGVARLISFGQQCQHVQVGALGLAIAQEFVRRMAYDQPCITNHINVSVGKYLDESARRGEGLFVFLHAVEVIGGCPKDDRSLFVRREGVGKLQRTADNIPSDLILIRRRCRAKLLPVCRDGRVAGLGGFFVGRVAIRGLLQLDGGGAELPIFQQQVRHLVVDEGRFGVRGERDQETFIPVQRLFEIRRFVFGLFRVLVTGMIMVRQVGQVGL